MIVKVREEVFILFYQSAEDKKRIVAHCLDYDLIGTGDDLMGAFEELEDVIQVQFKAWASLRNRGKNARMPKRAPKRYWDALKATQKLSPPLNILRRRKQTAQDKTKYPVPRTFKWACLKGPAPVAAAAV